MASSTSPRLGLVVVVYRRTPSEVPALEDRLTTQWGKIARWVVCDNSPEPVASLADYCRDRDIEYVWLGGSASLSRAYNHALGLLTDVEYVCMIDHDTSISDAYFSSVLRYSAYHSADVLMPVVRTSKHILSPCRVIGWWRRPLRRLGQLPRNFSCINSGLVISRDLANKCQFDERLFLDFIDHRFVETARLAGASFAAMWDCELAQDYSRETDDAASDLRRFWIFKHDILEFYSGSHGARSFGRLLILVRAIKATVKHKSLMYWQEPLRETP